LPPLASTSYWLYTYAYDWTAYDFMSAFGIKFDEVANGFDRFGLVFFSQTSTFIPFHVHRMNRVNSRSSSATMTAP